MMPLNIDPNSLPNDLRPLNIGRTVPEDPRVSPATSSGRPIDGFFPAPQPRDGNSPGGTIPVVYYPASTPRDVGLVGLGYSNPPPAVARWVQQVVPPTQSAVVATTITSPGCNHNCPVFGRQSMSSASDEGCVGDEWAPGRKLKFMCSFGGKILPRPSDGALRYVGGQTRIVSLRRDVSFTELLKKLTDTCGQDAVIKYQLPDEDLDALVTISCPDDLENMIDEYQKLLERSPDGSAKLRVFLFPSSEVDSPSSTIQFSDLQDGGQRYIDAVNGISENGGGGGGITRLSSSASVVSTQNSDVSSVDGSCSHGHSDIIPRSPSSDAISSQQEPSRMACNDNTSSPAAVYVNTASSAPFGIPMVMSGPPPVLLQPQTTGYDLKQPAGVTFPVPPPPPPPYMDHHQREASSPNRSEYEQPFGSQMGFPTQFMGTVRPMYAHHQQFVPGIHTTMSTNNVPPMFQPQQVLGGPHHGLLHHHIPLHHPLQVPVSEGQVVSLAHPMARYDDCHMCQKSLPHAHSDTMAQDKRGSPVSSIPDPIKLPRAVTSGAILDSPQSNLPSQYQVNKQESVVNNVVPDDLLTGGMRLPVTTEYLNHGLPNRYTKHFLSTEDKVIESPSNAYYGHLKHIEDKMETLRIQRAEILANTDLNSNNKSSPTIDKFRKNGFLESTSNLKPYETSPSTSPNLSASYELGGDDQESKNSVFSNQDPWSRMECHDASYHFPPQPNKLQISTKGVSQPFSYLDMDFGSEHSLSSKEHIIIKPEAFQTVAEGVAASVFHASSTSNDGKGSPPCTSEWSGEVNQIAHGEIQYRDAFEEMKPKSPVKESLGSPVSSDIGRLQIIKNSDLEEIRELGSGTFGTVYHGKWRGTDVAIKRINDRCFAGKPSEQQRMRDDFWNEAIKLADLHHPNVVAFYGVVLDGPGGSVATVTEFMVNGSLRNALHKSERILDKRKRLLISMDVAFGMEYLHGKNIVHFDLKSDNLLVNLRDPHRPICKVGDLGLSKVKCQTLISGGVRGTLPWMAPELLNGSSSLVSEKVDVFSFGIVMWELLTGEEPYADLHYGAIIGGIVSNTLRPSTPESCDADWKSLMERCWSAEPSERPTFTEIANELRAIATKLPSKGQQPAPSTQTQPRS
ncbi:unnamed protein product [Cuscuta epithymum]|uniref:Protein kinase domain-containing protein n=1 Tax=Cuscuta epithymum TaxID=186058 RepID=A0AAV0CW02_9ASTE|nr:unnamed protein product [Cuscuta epithymum]